MRTENEINKKTSKVTKNKEQKEAMKNESNMGLTYNNHIKRI